MAKLITHATTCDGCGRHRLIEERGLCTDCVIGDLKAQLAACLVGPKQEGEPPKDASRIFAWFGAGDPGVYRWDGKAKVWRPWELKGKPHWWAPINWNAVEGK